MKKLYLAENMVMNSRLIQLYKASDREKQQYMLQRVGELIKIYQSCQYPPLYGYLCNIFCSVLYASMTKHME